MARESLAQNAAHLCADVIVEALKPVFMPSEIPDARELIYETVAAAIHATLIMHARSKFIEPSVN